MPASDMRANRRDRRIDEVLPRPAWLGAADLQGEVAQDVRTERRVMHFRMKLHRPHFLLSILDSRDGMRRPSRQAETLRQLFRRISMRHPYRQNFRDALE